MLGWLTGATHTLHDNDATTATEPPATPAPLFAVRAFRSALFGAPGEAHLNEVGGVRTGRATAGSLAASAEDVVVPSEDVILNPTAVVPRHDLKPVDSQRQSHPSPAKPTGILLTPGLGASRRKRVSFGFPDSNSDKEEAIPDDGQRSRRTEIDSKSGLSSVALTTLTKTLIASRAADESENSRGKNVLQRPTESAGIKADSYATTTEHHQAYPGTSRPCISSECQWKLEYENYKLRTAQVVRKLLKYKHMAKEYARHRDAEAICLELRLEGEREKVKGLEQQISQLAASRALADPRKTPTTDQELIRIRDGNVAPHMDTERLRKGGPRRNGSRNCRDQVRSPQAEQAQGISATEPFIQRGMGRGRAKEVREALDSAQRPFEKSQLDRNPPGVKIPLGDLDLNLSYDSPTRPATTLSLMSPSKPKLPISYPSDDEGSDSIITDLQCPKEYMLARRSIQVAAATSSSCRSTLTVSNHPSKSHLSTRFEEGDIPRACPPEASGNAPRDVSADFVTSRKQSIGGQRLKSTLPPDRLAAAKARLELKKAGSRRQVIE